MSADAFALDPMRLALVGVPNSGKTALFNRLTGSRQKVANYAGVTVERKEGSFVGPSRRRQYRVLDLPGSYSLTPTTLDEAITRDFLLGRLAGEAAPEFVVCVVDATNLKLNLRLALELRDLGVPMVVALNMSDLARGRGFQIDRARLEQELGVPVVETVAVEHGGHRQLVEALEHVQHPGAAAARDWRDPSFDHIQQTQREVRRILHAIDYTEPARSAALQRLDALVMNPFAGPVILAVLLFFVFQAVFSWAAVPMHLIDTGVSWVGVQLHDAAAGRRAAQPARRRRNRGRGQRARVPAADPDPVPVHPAARGQRLPAARGVPAGPPDGQRRPFRPRVHPAAVELRLRRARHHGDADHPEHPRPDRDHHDRPADDLLRAAAGLRARHRRVHPRAGPSVRSTCPGWCCSCSTSSGIVAAMAVAYALKRTAFRASYHPLLLELPEYHWPHLNNLMIGLWERTKVFVRRVGTIILALMIVLWFLSSYPAPPPDATGPAIQYSLAGMLGRALEYVFAPLGFNWQISLALVPGLAAREVAVGALGTVYSLSATGDDVAATLVPMIEHTWSLATALSLLAWYVFAPQCLSTLAVVKRGDEFLALSAADGRVSLRACLPRGLRHVPRGPRARRGMRNAHDRDAARRCDRPGGHVLFDVGADAGAGPATPGTAAAGAGRVGLVPRLDRSPDPGSGLGPGQFRRALRRLQFGSSPRRLRISR